MKEPPLFFGGHAFPAVSISEWAATPPSARGWSEPRFALIEANGKGRPWVTTRLLGFWRNFAALNHQDETEIVAFVQRYGDPTGQLPSSPSDTLRWARIQSPLVLLASAWDPEDADGISHRTADEERLKRIRAQFKNPDTGPVGAIDSRFDDNGILRFEPANLAIYMTMTAMLMFQMRMPMRRCDQCGHWHGITDARSRFCSGACRNAAQRFKREN
jgi:hypothetical protein